MTVDRPESEWRQPGSLSWARVCAYEVATDGTTYRLVDYGALGWWVERLEWRRQVGDVVGVEEMVGTRVGEQWVKEAGPSGNRTQLETMMVGIMQREVGGPMMGCARG